MKSKDNQQGIHISQTSIIFVHQIRSDSLSLLVPDGADNRTGKRSDSDRTALFSGHDLAGLDVALPNNDGVVVLVTDGEEVTCLV